MNRGILKKNPTLCRAKNSYKLRVPGHLVTWIPHTEEVCIQESKQEVIIVVSPVQMIENQSGVSSILDTLVGAKEPATSGNVPSNMCTQRKF